VKSTRFPIAVPLALVAAAITQPLGAQAVPADRLADSVRVAIESAFATQTLAATDSALGFAGRAVAEHPDAPLLRHYQAYALYRVANLALAAGDKGRARGVLDRARDVLEALCRGPTIPESQALLASVYGLQIAAARIPMFSAVRLGPRSADVMAQAVKAGPRNPRVWLLKGIGDFNTPSQFGGGAQKAEASLLNALEFFKEDHPAPPLPAWGLAEAHLWLGRAYAAQRKVDLARAQYDTVLALEPNNTWVRKTLLPALSAK
jgi:tetratricopeptide (TPR) repeat protein